MKILHIIPSAFEYFDDIRAEAFALLKELDKLGVDADAFTLQYGSTTKEVKTSVSEIVKKETPAGKVESTHKYAGLQSVTKMFGDWENYDIIHLHCPFMGAAGRILEWVGAHPNIPLVVTFYHPMPFKDLFSIFFRWYNNYYLPKIFEAATAIICFDPVVLIRSVAGRKIKNTRKILELSRDSELLAKDLQMFYNTILEITN